MRSCWRLAWVATSLKTQRLLRLAGVSELWPKVRRDAIVIWSIKEGLSREECDDELWRLGEKTLFRCVMMPNDRLGGRCVI